MTVSAAFDEDSAEAFGSGIGLRAGAANFPAVTEESVRTRPSLGFYYHFAETAGRRFETGLDFSPSPVDLAENSYLLARLSYVGYLGEKGLFYWTLGGGGILEDYYGTQNLFGFVNAGAGCWLTSGDGGVDARLVCGVPLGPELNSLVIVQFSLGYDF